MGPRIREPRTLGSRRSRIRALSRRRRSRTVSLEFESLGPGGLGGLEFESSVFNLGDVGPEEFLGFRPGRCPLGSNEVDPWSNSYPPISLSVRLTEILCIMDNGSNFQTC
jgi:hypothetical protein